MPYSTIAAKVLYEYQPLLAVRYDCRSLETRAATESSNVMIFEHRLGPLFAEFEFRFASRSLRPLSRSFSSSHVEQFVLRLAREIRRQGNDYVAGTGLPGGQTALACLHVCVACRVNYFEVGVTSSEGRAQQQSSNWFSVGFSLVA